VLPAGTSGVIARGGELPAPVREAAARLGPALAVRSSSSVEDQAEGAAPGLFSSRLDIRPEELAGAIAEVVASAETPAVRAYLERRRTADTSLAVIVQRQVGGVSGVLYTRPPGQPDGDEVWVEAGHGVASTATLRRDGEPLARDPDFPLSAAELGDLVELGLAAEQAIGAGELGADVEWVAEPPDPEAEPIRAGARHRLWLVQARPIRRSPAETAADELAFSRGDPQTVWRWDASHNPDPLSPAQIGLVELVADIAPAPMRVVGGYLYVASRPSEDPAPDAEELRALFDDVRGSIERALAPVELARPPDLEGALDAYRAVYREYMVRLTPALSRARAALGGSAPAAESAVARAARGGDSEALSALAPVWDVAAPTFGELGDAAQRATDLARARPAPGEPERDATDIESTDAELASLVRMIGEADDLLFFRAQRAVRRALLALAGAWGLSPADDVFHLPFDQVRASASGEAFDPAHARRLALAARAARDGQRQRAAPLAFRDGRSIARAAPAGLDFWRGRSAGRGTARGQALRVDDLGHLDADPQGRVIVARSITPASVIQLAGAAALVCEQGGVLDHAAALARELGLPCVVGCAGAWHALGPRDQVLVDGDAGLVVRLADDASS